MIAVLLANPIAMSAALPSASAHAAPQQLFLGLVAALSLTLVAFEWRLAGARPHWGIADALPLEGEWELLPMAVRSASASAESAKPAARAAGDILNISDDALTGESSTPDEGQPAEGMMGAASDSLPAFAGNAPETIEEVFIPWRKGDERMPCWTGCEQLAGEAREACTEARIQRYLDRQFRVPPHGPREEFTVVTLEIGADGRPSLLACRPKPSAAVEEEVRRVATLMPAFIAGEQNGQAVRVIYQLPLRVARR